MMRSLFTPSRVFVVVITFSLISFLWTFGLPHQLAELSAPIIEHPADGAKPHDSIAPAPVVHTSHATFPTVKPTSTVHDDRPKGDDDHRWDDKTRKTGQAAEQTPLPRPTASGPAGHDDDRGRWEDKEKSKASGKTSSTVVVSASPGPIMELISSANTTTTPTPTSISPPYRHTAAPVKGFCKDVKNAQDVMVVVKTSKAEAYDKLSGHLQGLLSCVPNFAIFSDHEGEIDGIPIHDALHEINSETRQNNGEFREYMIIQADPEYKPDAKKTKDLDKWKVLPMVYKAYQMNPHAKFYAFIEADTGLSWTNLLQWVARLDYRIPYYSGAQTFINKVQFAQRGPGILLSQGALRRYAKSYEERWSTDWQKRIGKECCGDYVLATALNDAHVELYTSWPLMQGEQPNTLDYTPKQWCSPAVTWHHMDNKSLSESWDLQKKWTAKHGWEKPYLHKDAFEEYVLPHITSRLENWDNLGSDTRVIAEAGRQKELKDGVRDANAAKEKPREAAGSLFPKREEKKGIETDTKKDDKKNEKIEEEAKETIDWTVIGTMVKDGADSSEACAALCLEIEDCLQWRYTNKGDGECHLSKVVKLGRKTENQGKSHIWTSGWIVDRIRGLTKGWECKEVKWKFYQ
ncbi:glycosyltransferase family 31 protein [Didymella exigua CBS 183.55]|uniref:Glycosyltransferase family 31 protein n=1 Tax=Didymella exigua CBS 183.55 TaxID=1150837 RepID=A0A6A5RCQ6_9PLEO|nr:glycosyltransferase family 31 protein [Didymella exigua CBS 183.55]KAF1925169.1 glycosyltransferase family 31 protein [Didymella exigua CBS 183.55]